MATRVAMARLPSALLRPSRGLAGLPIVSGCIPRATPRLVIQQKRCQSVAATNTLKSPIQHDFAFAFDIDGVLLHGSTPIPSAHPALKHLQTSSTPFLLLTNGGGTSETARVTDLTRKLGLPIHESQFVQSHTPFKTLASQGYLTHPTTGQTIPLENAILVLGGAGDNVRSVAEGYGFKNVVMSQDILAHYPTLWPFSTPNPRDVKPIPPHLLLPSSVPGSPPTIGPKFDAIFVFNDPRDWALDTQLILDLVLSHNGTLGTSPSTGSHTLESLTQNSPPIYFSNPDMIWSSPHPFPRMGQGAFHTAVEGVWASHPHNPTPGSTLPNTTIIGKPHRQTYLYAENVLADFIAASNRNRNGKNPGLKRVYMVGDNPDSDIRGANEFVSGNGIEWVSVLVRTGVFRGDRPPAHVRPRMVVEDVWEAVRWAFEREERIAKEGGGVE